MAGGLGDAEPGRDPRLGARVGAFRLVERIGQGGMGEVYLAERADGQFAQRAAVKLLRAGFDGAWGAARFRAEREILARLEHPHIARLLDGGVTDDGLPYLVMEHVRGEPITAFCDARRLALEARLRLFVDVCRAVQGAHQSLVVHRDLKPANILVDGRGEVKLLDFGIAKLLEGGAPEAATRTGHLLLTPEYASPEQVRGEVVTTATDVYALGLLLFELLTGRRAQPVADLSPLGIARAVCAEEPPRASAAALAEAAGEAPGERAARRGSVSPEALARRLRGDLDTVVAAALRKDPARRYPSAEALADDVERHLASFPVRARADSFAYRTGRFLSRHRLAVAASAAVVVALLVGLLLAVSGLLRARRAEAEARREAETSRRVSNLLAGVFSVNDPGEARGATVTARELLDRGAERVQAELAGQPEVQGNLLRTMGRAYAQLGLYARAQALFESDLALRRQHDGADHPETAASLTLLADALVRRGDYARARELSRQALAIEEARHLDGLATARTLSMLGVAEWQLGDLAAARRSLERSLAIRERARGADDPELGGVLNNLAIVHWQMGDLAGAQPLYDRALALYQRRYGERHPAVAHTLNNLALLHLEAGRLAAAAALHRRALAIRRALLAADHPDVAESLNNLAVVLLRQGDAAAARPLLDEALAIREKALGPDHPVVASTVGNLGLALADLGQPAAARPLLERAVRILTRSLGPDHPDLAAPLEVLAEIDRRAGNLAAADRTSARVLALRERVPGGGVRVGLKNALELRAGVLRDLGRADEAKTLEARAAAL